MTGVFNILYFFDKGLNLLQDLIINPVFLEKEIAKEKELILAGIKRADDDNFSIGRTS